MNSEFWVLDTETTGFDPKQGHKMIEIGAIKVVDGAVTDEYFHVYIDPQRSIPDEAVEVHGMTRDDVVELGQGQVFSDIADDLLDLFRNQTLVIHNANFDMSFLDYELEQCGLPKLSDECEMVIDTLEYAKTIHPRGKHNLDALAKKYGADSIERTVHGALLDAKILAVVFTAMCKAQKHFSAQDISKSMQSKRREISLSDVVKRLPETKTQNLKALTTSDDNEKEHNKYLSSLDEGLSW